MTKTVCTALFLSSVIVLAATYAKAESAGTYRDALKQCGQEWRASDARKSVEKGKGREAWNAFRKDCVTRVGYQRKSRATN